MEVAMQLCPYCHSSHVLQLKNVQQESQLPSISLNSLSPMALATMGVQVSKRYNIHPVLGGVAGLVIGGVVYLYTQYKNSVATRYFICEQCQKYFEVQ